MRNSQDMVPSWVFRAVRSRGPGGWSRDDHGGSQGGRPRKNQKAEEWILGDLIWFYGALNGAAVFAPWGNITNINQPWLGISEIALGSTQNEQKLN